jgi:hypothetical protein
VHTPNTVSTPNSSCSTCSSSSGLSSGLSSSDRDNDDALAEAVEETLAVGERLRQVQEEKHRLRRKVDCFAAQLRERECLMERLGEQHALEIARQTSANIELVESLKGRVHEQQRKMAELQQKGFATQQQAEELEEAAGASAQAQVQHQEAQEAHQEAQDAQQQAQQQVLLAKLETLNGEIRELKPALRASELAHEKSQRGCAVIEKKHQAEHQEQQQKHAEELNTMQDRLLAAEESEAEARTKLVLGGERGIPEGAARVLKLQLARSMGQLKHAKAIAAQAKNAVQEFHVLEMNAAQAGHLEACRKLKKKLQRGEVNLAAAQEERTAVERARDETMQQLTIARAEVGDAKVVAEEAKVLAEDAHAQAEEAEFLLQEARGEVETAKEEAAIQASREEAAIACRCAQATAVLSVASPTPGPPARVDDTKAVLYEDADNELGRLPQQHDSISAVLTRSLELVYRAQTTLRFQAWLCSGLSLLKHGRRGKPRKRTLFLSACTLDAPTKYERAQTCEDAYIRAGTAGSTDVVAAVEFESMLQHSLRPDDDLQLCWRARTGGSSSGSGSSFGGGSTSGIRLVDVTHVNTGVSSGTLLRSGSAKRSNLYLSLVTPQRTLDLEASSEEERDALVKGFRLLVEGRQANTAHQQQADQAYARASEEGTRGYR